jgi:hypothetical protein
LFVNQPQLAAKKPLTPIRPRFAAVLPLALHGVHGKKIGIRGEEMAQLLLCKSENTLALAD